MATTPTRTGFPRSVTVLVLLAVLALLAYYYWPRATPAPAPATVGQPAPVEATAGVAPGVPVTGYGPGARDIGGGILVDADGNRILNSAGLPISKEPLPQAKPIPIKAAPGEIIGYSTDAQGNSQPIRAGELKSVPNAPGTFAVVDMWADGGPTVVAPTRGNPVSAAELAKMRAEEDARDRGPTRP